MAMLNSQRVHCIVGQWFICFKMVKTTNQYTVCIYISIWVNYNDLTATSLEIIVRIRGIIPNGLNSG